MRCVQLGLSMSDLEYLDIGTILDMMTEKGNDNYEYAELATAEDIAKF